MPELLMDKAQVGIKEVGHVPREQKTICEENLPVKKEAEPCQEYGYTPAAAPQGWVDLSLTRIYRSHLSNL